jgi:hypothetical protein
MKHFNAHKPATAMLLLILWTCRAFVSSNDVLDFFNQGLTPDQSAVAKVVTTPGDVYQVFYPKTQPRRMANGSDESDSTVRRSTPCNE